MPIRHLGRLLTREHPHGLGRTGAMRTGPGPFDEPKSSRSAMPPDGPFGPACPGRCPGLSGRPARDASVPPPFPIPSARCSSARRCPTGRASSPPGCPASRSVTIEAHVLAGSRHEDPEQAGCAHFMEHLTFKGTRAFPTTRARLRGRRGDRRHVQRLDRPRVDRLLRAGCRSATRPWRWTSWASSWSGRSSTRTRSSSERDVIVEEIRSYLDDPASTSTSSSTWRSSATRRSAGRSPATEETRARPAGRRHPPLLARLPTGRPTSSWPLPGTWRTRMPSALVGAGVRDRQRGQPLLARGADAAAGRRALRSSSDRARRRSSSSACRACRATIPTSGRSRCSTPSSATACRAGSS